MKSHHISLPFSLLILITFISVNSLDVHLECAEDVVGITCHFPADIHAQTIVVVSVNGTKCDADVVEIELRNVSRFMPKLLGQHFRLIENLIIRDSDLKDLQRLDFTGNLWQLEVLSLFNNKIVTIAHDTFADLERLRHLDIENNLIKTLHPQLLANNVNLRTFLAGYNEIEEIDENFFGKNLKLWKVSLSENKIANFKFNIGKFKDHLKSLRYFSLGHNVDKCNICLNLPWFSDNNSGKLQFFQWDIEEKCFADYAEDEEMQRR